MQFYRGDFMAKDRKRDEIYDLDHFSHFRNRIEDNKADRNDNLSRRRPQRPPFIPNFDQGPASENQPAKGFHFRPSTPPPRYIPRKPVAIAAVEPGALRPCTFRFSYIWLVNGRQFWAYLVYIGRRSVAGFRWTGFNWVYFGTDMRNIESFVCL